MKKISKFFMLFAVLVMGMGLAFQSCGGVTAATLAAQINAECPADCGNGLVMESAQADGSVLTINISIPDGIDPNTLTSIDGIKEAFIQGCNEDDPEFTKTCGSLGVSMKILFKNDQGEAFILCSPEELQKY